MNQQDKSEYYRSVARELAEKFAPKAANWDRSRTYCWENVRDLVDAGLMGMTIPKEYGGQSASFYDTVVVVEEIARACTLSARIVVESRENILAVDSVQLLSNMIVSGQFADAE